MTPKWKYASSRRSFIFTRVTIIYICDFRISDWWMHTKKCTNSPKSYRTSVYSRGRSTTTTWGPWSKNCPHRISRCLISTCPNWTGTIISKNTCSVFDSTSLKNHWTRYQKRENEITSEFIILLIIIIIIM